MDDSLTNLVNESQVETNIYKLEINMSDEDRINLSRCLYLFSFILNIFLLFSSSLIANIICFIFSLLFVAGGVTLIYKNNDYINNNLILFSIYVLSISFELFLILNNNSSFIGLFFSIVYQSMYIVNYE